MSGQSDLVSLYVLGALDGDEAAHAQAVLAADPGLRRELEVELEVTMAALGGGLHPETPDPAVRLRLLDTIAAPPRDTGLAARVAALFDVAVEQARAMFGWLDERSRWAVMAPGIDIAKVAAGPAQAGTQCALVRLAPGVRFPWHTHAGEEHAMVIVGGARMSDGRAVGPGDEVIADETVSHDFVADADGPCVFAVRAEGWRIVPRPD